MDRYPIINHEWGYIGGKYGGLRDYIIRVSGSCNNKIVNYNISYFSGIVEYFVRYSDYDDDRYVIDRNKDPWNRKFFMYKTEKVNISNLNVFNNKYRCIPLIGSGGKVLMYVITSSVNYKVIFCLDIITNNCVV